MWTQQDRSETPSTPIWSSRLSKFAQEVKSTSQKSNEPGAEVTHNVYHRIVLTADKEKNWRLLLDTLRQVNLCFHDMEENMTRTLNDLGDHRMRVLEDDERIGGKSITVSVEARKFNVYSHEESVVCSTRLVFVRLDDDGKSIPIAKHVREKYPDKCT